MEKKDYNYYRYKAGLNWDKYIALHPEIDGEELFTTFMKRLDNYTHQRDVIIDKFAQRFIDEKDEEKYNRIEGEKMYALAQLEQVFLDVIRVAFGLDPDDKYAVFGDKIATRYSRLVDGYICDGEDTGLYKGADGLYRIATFYDDDSIDINVMFRWCKLKEEGKVYQTEEDVPKDSYDIELFIEGQKIKLPEDDSGDGEKDIKKQLNVVYSYLLENENKDKDQKKITDFFN